MIQLAIALLVGFVTGWLILITNEVQFSIYSAVVLLSLLEALTFGWIRVTEERKQPGRISLNLLITVHFLVGAIFGFIVLQFGESIGSDLQLAATLPIATVFLLNLYKIVSFSENKAEY